MGIKPQIDSLGFQIAFITYIEMINPRIQSLLLKISSTHVTWQENAICFDDYKMCH
jgi:hypothetical protein